MFDIILTSKMTPKHTKFYKILQKVFSIPHLKVGEKARKTEKNREKVDFPRFFLLAGAEGLEPIIFSRKSRVFRGHDIFLTSKGCQNKGLRGVFIP